MIQILDDKVSLNDISTITIRKYSIVGAATLLVWEFLSTVQDEYDLIWKKPMNYIKCIYIFTRYFGLGAQILNVYLALNTMNKLPLSEGHCRSWFLFLAISFTLLFLVVQVIAGLRVYALYKKDSRIGAMFVTLFIIEVSLGTTCMYPAYTTIAFDTTCDMTEIPPLLTHCVLFIVLSQSVMVGSMVAKAWVVPRHVPVVHIVLRDGIVVFVLLCGMCLGIVPEVVMSPVLSPHKSYIWPITILSISGCKMITNMYKITAQHSSGIAADSDIPLTTVNISDIE
ncbi:hypothetical protein BDQ17DRAFT_1545040 [Cyathus striatus]|nr:hypothetical protein BDQ17DRAFT_1545040 [Cyathus striatus]